jgi:diacylglycerol O-acyltransferase
MKTLGLKPDNSPVPFTAPRSIFNVPISGARRFATASLSLSEIKKLGKTAGATVNDMLLGICAGALRKYLQEHKALPTETLLANVPVSIRQINRPGNQITYVGARLCTDERDPLKRLQNIGVSTSHAKQEVAEVSPAAAISFAVMAQGLVAVLNRFHLTDLLPPPANVTISNVPGPRAPLYFGGARMLVNYPLSVLVDGQALNITVISYCDSIDFGLMACRDAVPDVDRLGTMITEAFAELKNAIEKGNTGGQLRRKKTLKQARAKKA